MRQFHCALTIIISMFLASNVYAEETIKDINGTLIVNLPSGFRSLGSQPVQDGIGADASTGAQYAYESNELPIRVYIQTEGYINDKTRGLEFDIKKACIQRANGIKEEGSSVDKQEIRSGSCYIENVTSNGHFVFWRIFLSDNKKAIFKIAIDTFPTSKETSRQYEKIAKETIESFILRGK